MFHHDIPLALTFDDVLMMPGASEVLPSEASLTTRLTVKALASSNEIPGYGSANYAIGMEWHF